MKYRYAHLSPGYLGELANELTLNSKFYSLLNFNLFEQRNSLDNEIILFPQRVPRFGFFDELYQLEISHFKTEFTTRLYHYKNNLKCTVQMINKKQDEKDIRYYLNLANLCLRYGCHEIIMELSPSCSLPSFALEIELLKEAAHIELLLSNDLPVSADNYLSLAEKYLPCKSTSDREKIMLLNQLIVTFYRHQKNASNSSKIYKLAKILLELLEKFEQCIPLNQLYCSVGYRGLAMVSEFGVNLQSEFINKAEYLAIKLRGQSQSEEIVALENKYTCFQSIAKWYHQNNDTKSCEIYLNNLIQIDPYDSTGHSELGFYYVQIEEFQDAGTCFKKAMELGPPGVGMNAYYYAKCLEKLGRKNEAVEYLQESAELDQQALSPWLDLTEYYLNENYFVRARETAKHILSTKILFEQLEKDELIKLQAILD